MRDRCVYWIRCVGATLLWISLFQVGLIAQFSHGKLIDQRSGLSDTRVTDIEKDQYGFMWIGTQSGLNRFDGSHFRHFLYDNNDSKSLLNTAIFDLVVDSQQVWVSGRYGISSIDLKDFTIRNIQFDCDGILDTIDLNHDALPNASFMHLQGDILWICTYDCGLIKYHTREHALQRISFAGHRVEVPEMSSSTALDQLIGFAADPTNDSIYWIGTAAGLIRFNHETQTHSLFFKRDPDLLYQDAVNNFRRIVYHDNGLIYYLVWGRGVHIFDTRTHAFYPLTLAHVDDPYLARHISTLRKHDERNLWIRTPNGLYLYNTELHDITSSYPNLDKTTQYSYTDYSDEAGRRWIASNKGIYLFDPLHEQFLVFSYAELNVPDWYGFARKVVAHPDGSVITVLGQSVDALYHFSHRGNRWFETPIPGFTGNPREGFNGIDFELNEKYGWVFSGLTGIYAFDPETFTVTEITIDVELQRKNYDQLEWDHQGNLWIGTKHEGILKYNPQTKHTTHYLHEIYGEGIIHAHPFALSLFCDSQGNIWFATGNGHSVYEAKSGRFWNFSFDTDQYKTFRDIARFVEDDKGTIWCVSHSGFLGRAAAKNPADGIRSEGSVFRDGTPASYVEGIVYGEEKLLYVLSETALIRIDSTLAISSFSFDYAEFIGDSYSFDNLFESSLVVGLRNSFAVLNGNELLRNRELPQPYLTEITINEKPLTGNFITPPSPLKLKHNQNFMSFSFSAIGYTLPERNQFRYRLFGFDPAWIDAGTRRFANYTNIPKGDYFFELQVANNEGMWNPVTYSVPVSIAPAWWNTWLFRILSFLSIVSGIILVYRMRVRQIRKETNLKSEFERKIGDVELSALRAQMNPHFIFNCLNSIENYILKNESYKAAEYINDFARLIRLILQNSRSQYIPLKDEIEALDLYLQMESLRFDNKFEYKINLVHGLEPSEVDIPPMLIQPFVENAIWHGLIPKNGPGKLEIDLSRTNGILQCVIQDNGIGREKSREINASMHKRGKKSMGMLITQNRIDVFNELYHTKATVNIVDLKDAQGTAMGTRVELNIPIE